jgi:hypothetical protein
MVEAPLPPARPKGAQSAAAPAEAVEPTPEAVPVPEPAPAEDVPFYKRWLGLGG